MHFSKKEEISDCMFNQLLQIYPDAVISSQPSANPQLLWVKDSETNSFIGIPIERLSEGEITLLNTLFPIDHTNPTLRLSPIAKEWRNYLILDGPFPPFHSENIRFIHYMITNIRSDFQYDEWKEAVKSLFSNEVLIVPLSHHHGVIIEEERNLAITETELFSAIEAFESDFFIKIHFFISHFKAPHENLRALFKLEKKLLELSLSEHPEERIFTREKSMPIYAYQNLLEKDRQILFSDIHTILADDPELSKTIKTYIENQSNATLTAKKLFMHRNSLQYRIDKFIEKTGIDIKSFHGAFFTYLACLHIFDE